MTVAETIKALEAIEDKTKQVYFDCPKCGASTSMVKMGYVVLVKTEEPKR